MLALATQTACSHAMVHRAHIAAASVCVNFTVARRVGCIAIGATADDTLECRFFCFAALDVPPSRNCWPLPDTCQCTADDASTSAEVMHVPALSWYGGLLLSESGQLATFATSSLSLATATEAAFPALHGAIRSIWCVLLTSCRCLANFSSCGWKI